MDPCVGRADARHAVNGSQRHMLAGLVHGVVIGVSLGYLLGLLVR